MFGGTVKAVPLLNTEALVVVAAIMVGLVITHWLMRNRTLESVLARAPAVLLSCTWAVMVFAIIATQGNGNAFIYFQF
jgi:alginate O-acetyltransferase complex protein AlgI